MAIEGISIRNSKKYKIIKYSNSNKVKWNKEGNEFTRV